MLCSHYSTDTVLLTTGQTSMEATLWEDFRQEGARLCLHLWGQALSSPIREKTRALGVCCVLRQNQGAGGKSDTPVWTDTEVGKGPREYSLQRPE